MTAASIFARRSPTITASHRYYPFVFVLIIWHLMCCTGPEGSPKSLITNIMDQSTTLDIFFGSYVCKMGSNDSFLLFLPKSSFISSGSTRDLIHCNMFHVPFDQKGLGVHSFRVHYVLEHKQYAKCQPTQKTQLLCPG